MAIGEKIVKIMKSNRLLVIVLVSLVLIGSVILIDLLSFSNVSSLMTEQLKENQESLEKELKAVKERRAELKA